VEELCNVAESLIVPVRMGIARPTAPFTLASTSIDAVQGSEELFSVEPLPPRPSPDQSSRLVLCLFSPQVESKKFFFVLHLGKKNKTFSSYGSSKLVTSDGKYIFLFHLV